MTKYIKPGQLITINNCVYKAYKRVNGCQGCDLNDLSLCPCITDKRHEQKYNCMTYMTILKRLN